MRNEHGASRGASDENDAGVPIEGQDCSREGDPLFLVK
jgi:hypothetical protein